ncbi:MAG: PhzF family phenazine biosynthesis protein [Calditrichaeota bacterium]|nr:PhzF family phenazine biosynthesis protein [Calditrichota bacterium]
MEIPIYQVDAFTSRLFSGNPAAVCPLPSWLDDALLQAIASENNLSETAFYVKQRDGTYRIRWFTPVAEVDLCGHATLAAAYVIFQKEGYSNETIRFHSRSGPLAVKQTPDGLEMDFPAQPPIPCETPPALQEALQQTPVACWKAQDYLAVFRSAAEIRNLQPDFSQLKKLDLRGVIVTAPGNGHDFVLRFFAPKLGVDEDPVTGSAFTQLVPYWAERLGKTSLTARQLSKRGGEVKATLVGDRVAIRGQAVLYLEGKIYIPDE